MYSGQCQACDEYTEVDGNMLCRDCAAQLERDMIRSRQWRYSVNAWALKDNDREKLRELVVEKYGENYELIEAPTA